MPFPLVLTEVLAMCPSHWPRPLGPPGFSNWLLSKVFHLGPIHWVLHLGASHCVVPTVSCPWVLLTGLSTLCPGAGGSSPGCPHCVLSLGAPHWVVPTVSCPWVLLIGLSPLSPVPGGSSLGCPHCVLSLGAFHWVPHCVLYLGAPHWDVPLVLLSLLPLGAPYALFAATECSSLPL